MIEDVMVRDQAESRRYMKDWGKWAKESRASFQRGVNRRAATARAKELTIGVTKKIQKEVKSKVVVLESLAPFLLHNCLEIVLLQVNALAEQRRKWQSNIRADYETLRSKMVRSLNFCAVCSQMCLLFQPQHARLFAHNSATIHQPETTICTFTNLHCNIRCCI